MRKGQKKQASPPLSNENKLALCEFICVKSEDPPIHSKVTSPPQTSKFINSKNNSVKKQESTLNINSPLKIDYGRIKENKKVKHRRKQFNEKSKTQICNQKRHMMKNIDYGLIAKFMKNFKSDGGKPQINDNILNSSIVFGKENENNMEKQSHISIYNILCRPKKNEEKKKKNWFKEFIQKDTPQSRIDGDETFEFIDKETPGPANYILNQENSEEKQENKKTFGSGQRFSYKRPITATVDYPQTKQIKKNISHNQNTISFGTLKKNHRSSIRKVQYCDWYRSHCCEKMPSIQAESENKAKHMDPHFASRKKRFEESKKKYTGPDYYLKVFNKKKVLRTRSGFLSGGERSNAQEVDERDFSGQNFNTIKKKMSKEESAKNTIRKKCKYEFARDCNEQQNEENLKEYIPDQARKNSGNKAKRKGLPEYPYHQTQKRNAYPSPTDYSTKRSWVIESFNMKQQLESK